MMDTANQKRFEDLVNQISSKKKKLSELREENERLAIKCSTGGWEGAPPS